jgi:hypothetical protein
MGCGCDETPKTQKVRVYVSRANVARNKEHGVNLPAIVVERDGQRFYGTRVELPKGATVIQSDDPNASPSIWVEGPEVILHG